MPSLGLPIYGQKSSLGARRWRTLEELERGAADAKDEFPEGAAEAPEGLSRRNFLQVLGASAALAGLGACKPPRESVVPYVRQPPSVTPSIPSSYATAIARDGYAVGVVVTSWEGRPTKVEGNRQHPASRGGSDAILQAVPLDLYDPARLSGFTGKGRTFGTAGLLAELATIAREHVADGGARLRFLVEPTTSPTLGELRRRILARFPKARFDTWSATADDAARAGAALAFGRPLEPTLRLADADVILSLDADLLAHDGEPLRQAAEFAARREPPRLVPGSPPPREAGLGRGMNRLYVAEPSYTITGGMADHRFRMRGAEVAGFARAVAAELAARHGLPQLAPLGAPAEGERAKAAAAVAKDLAGSRGRSVVVAGLRQPPAVHALAAAVNDALGNVGKTVVFRPSPLVDSEPGSGRLARLAQEMEAGQVETLVVTAWNPLYTAPADVDLRRAFRKVPRSIVLALRDDETVRGATMRLAASHPFEAWGDLRARDGTVSVVQPLVAPLHETITEVELLAAFVDDVARGGWKIVRDGWRARAGFGPPPPSAVGTAGSTSPPDTNKALKLDPFDRRWDEWLAAGVAAGAIAGEAPRVDVARVAQAIRALPAPAAGLEAGFAPDYKVHDGRWLENAWLLEWPHPVTKLTWDAAAMLSPATAKRLGLSTGDVATLALGGRRVDAPVVVVPGHADDAVTLPLGYGQPSAGAVGKAGVQFDAYALRTAGAPWFAGGLEVKPAGRKVELGITQGHFSTEGRAIALSMDAGELPHAKKELDEHRGEPDDDPEAGGLLPAGVPLGHGDRPEPLRRLRRVHPRLPGGEQHPGRREGGRAPQPRDALAPRGPLLHRHRRGPLLGLAAARLRALRGGPLRVRLPRQRHRPLRRGAERDGLQPVRRDPVLLEQLPVQGPPVQLVRLPRRGRADPQDADEPGRHRARPRRHGEVHVLHAADRAHPRRGAERRAEDRPRRGGPRVRAGVPRGGDRLRQPERRDLGRLPQARGRAPLRPPARARDAPADRLPREASEPEPRARMSTTAPKTISGDPLESAPVLVGRPDDRALTESLLRPVLEPTRKGWARCSSC